VFDVRLRLAEDNGTRGRVLPTLTAAVTGYAAPQLRFTVSEQVAGKLDAPFLVLVEYSTGGAFVRPRNDLFIVDEDSADSIDATGAVTFSAPNVFGWLASRYPIWWRPGDSAEFQREYVNQTPGLVLRDLIDWAKAQHGWGPGVSTAFSNTVDSAGAAWADRVSQSWPLFTTTLARVIDGLTSQGYLETWTEGFQLHAVNPGTGVDRSDTVTLGGPSFSRAPGKRVFDPATAIIVQYDTGWTHFENPGASGRFGNVFKVMSQTGAPDRASAEKNVQPALTEGRATQEELSYEWTVADGTPRPWADFQVGDLVTARTRRGKKTLRVIGLDVSKDAKDKITARVIVGSKILDLAAKAAKRTAAASVGQIIGGSGATPSPIPSRPSVAPVAPEGLHVESNAGSWRADGTAVSTVELAWLGVTQAVDGSTVDVDTYEVWARRADEAPSLAFQTSALTVTTDRWAPGVTRYVSVRARSRADVWSDFSPEIAVTPAEPASIIPRAPIGLAVTSNVASFRADGTAVATVTVEWDPVTRSTDGALVDTDEYQVMVGLDTHRVTTETATFSIPSGGVVAVTVKAHTTLGVWGDPSATLEVTGAAPASTLAAPSTPILTTGLSTVSGVWDGKIGDITPPSGFGHVRMETASELDGPWSPVGTPLVTAGGAVIRSTMGATVHVRLTSYDTLGRVGATSPVASIVVEGVDGDNIIAGTIEVNHVSPAFGNDLQISANSSVQIIVGRQDEQASSLATLEDGVEGAQSTAAGAAAAAGAAQSAATGAQSVADAASAAASDVAERLDRHQTYYRFGTTGLAIGDPNTNAELRLQPDAIQMAQNNVVVSEWVGGVFIAPEARLQSALIGSHQWLPYGAGRTIVRPI
jgi:hypothetical protein